MNLETIQSLVVHKQPESSSVITVLSGYCFARRRAIGNRKAEVSDANAPIRLRPDDWLGFFAARGWAPKEIRYLMPEGERHHRPPPVPP